MPLYSKLPDSVKEVDVIVAGGKDGSPLKAKKSPLTITLAGGLTGCVVAGRLAEADPKLEILLIEQGPDNYGVPEIVYVESPSTAAPSKSRRSTEVDNR